MMVRFHFGSGRQVGGTPIIVVVVVRLFLIDRYGALHVLFRFALARN